MKGFGFDRLPLGTSELFRRTSGLVIIPQLDEWDNGAEPGRAAYRDGHCSDTDKSAAKGEDVKPSLQEIARAVIEGQLFAARQLLDLVEVLGLLVCLLIAGTGIPQEARLSQGWVMFVSVTVFLCSMAQLTLYLLAIPEQTTAWVCLETAYYGAAFALYFSAATLQANFTASGSSQDVRLRLNTAATVFIFAVVTLYGFSFLISLKRWKDTRAGTDAMKAARQASESPAKP